MVPSTYSGGPVQLSDAQLGSIAARLALYPQAWIERRVQGVTFVDDTTVRQRISVTIRHPPAEFFSQAAQPTDGQTIYLPLDLLSKKPLRKLDVAYEDGSTFAVPATARNGEIASRGLTDAVWGYSQQTRGGLGLSARSLTVLDLLVKSPATAANELLRVIDDRTEELSQVLAEANELRALADDLARNFWMLAPVRYVAGGERVLKYSYTLPLPWKFQRRDFAAYLGFADFRRVLDRLPIGFGASYHLTVDAPDDVRLTRGRLFGSYAADEAGNRVTLAIAEDGDNPVIDLHARRPRASVLHTDKATQRRSWLPSALGFGPAYGSVAGAGPAGDPVQRAEAYRPTDTQRSDRGFADLHFRPMFASVAPLAAISVLTAVGLAFIRPRLAQADDQTMSAVVLALPIVGASFLARPGEHAFATRLLRGFRLQALIVGVCALGIAAILGLGFIKRPLASSFDCRPSSGVHATRGQRLCRSRPAELATVPNDVQLAVNFLTAVAVVIAAGMLLGSIRIVRPMTTRPSRDGDADS